METGKVKTWVATKAALRNIVIAEDGADIGVYENFTIYQYTLGSTAADDNDTVLRVSPRSKGAWVKQVKLNSSELMLIKSPNNSGVDAEIGDWKFYIDVSNNLLTAKYTASGWVITDTNTF